MPLLFALGQHEALQAVSRQLRPDERLFATLGVESPCVHRVHTGKTKIWNQAGVLRCVMCWRESKEFKTQQPQCGRDLDQESPSRNKGSRFWIASGAPSVRGQTRQLERTSVKHQDSTG